ncbi:unnamed protein product [Ectocarpus sp. 6 AP-2014]
MEVEAFQRLDPENFYRRFVKNGVRPDGRELRAVRPISVDVGVLSEERVQASALVGLGSTKVLAGISLQVGHPSENTPMCGMLDVEVKLTPLSSSKFSSGRPSEQAHVLSTFVKNSIVESGALVLTDLAIDDGSFAWKLCMDIVCLSFDGNLADATLIAAMGALMRLQLPGTRRIDDEIFVTEDTPTPLVVREVPVPLTCGMFDGIITADPSLLEEELLTTHVTVVSTSEGKVCGVHKPGGSCASGKQLNECLQLCQQHAKQLTQTLEAAVRIQS